jgi:hypothetical protein
VFTRRRPLQNPKFTAVFIKTPPHYSLNPSYSLTSCIISTLTLQTRRGLLIFQPKYLKISNLSLECYMFYLLRSPRFEYVNNICRREYTLSTLPHVPDVPRLTWGCTLTLPKPSWCTTAEHAQNFVFRLLVNNQLDALFQCIYLFHFSTCFEHPNAHHQENQLYQYIIWYVSLCVGDCLVCQSGSSFLTGIPDSHLHIIRRINCISTSAGI